MHHPMRKPLLAMSEFTLDDPSAIDTLTSDEVAKLAADNVALVKIANNLRLSMESKPYQSNFRVLALLCTCSSRRVPLNYFISVLDSG